MSPKKTVPYTELIDDPVVDALCDYVAARSDALRERGVVLLALFGSFARGEGGAESDVDLLYEFAPDRTSLDALLDVQDEVQAVTGRDVHLVSRRHLHPLVRERVLGEAVEVFSASESV